ncbi:hypothetical protein Bhyg_15338 [Pseudolycoriella hygida]|uniref:Uncharacterized protein n=1 Tax=Pseudolycoriella hygida TaxID=35572 RepID=A0A9Q0MSC1_9DIPT|nr:hypothetical protein Bhyg_15338 [Pseudolycoriella hygida]
MNANVYIVQNNSPLNRRICLTILLRMEFLALLGAKFSENKTSTHSTCYDHIYECDTARKDTDTVLWDIFRGFRKDCPKCSTWLSACKPRTLSQLSRSKVGNYFSKNYQLSSFSHQAVIIKLIVVIIRSDSTSDLTLRFLFELIAKQLKRTGFETNLKQHLHQLNKQIRKKNFIKLEGRKKAGDLSAFLNSSHFNKSAVSSHTKGLILSPPTVSAIRHIPMITQNPTSNIVIKIKFNPSSSYSTTRQSFKTQSLKCFHCEFPRYYCQRGMDKTVARGPTCVS